MWNSLYADEIDRSLTALVQTPRDPYQREPGAFEGLLGAIPSGIVQGALETGRAAINVGVTGYRMGGFSRDDRGKSTEEVFAKGENEWAKKAGEMAKSFDPDPETSGTAAQILQGFARIGTKAVGYVGTLGPAGGAVALGADEAITEGMKLSDKGVDPTTAAAAGAIHGVLTGVGAALPIAGATLGRTAAIAAVGGPGTFMVEQQAIREVLRNAKYDHLAAEYDPFDMIGLAASVAAPAAFGAAVHLRRAGKARADALLKEGEAARPLEAPEEVQDAARVSNLTQHELDLVRGKAQASGTSMVEEMAALETGKADVAGRLQRGDPVVPRETMAEPPSAAPLRPGGIREWFGESKIVDAAGAPLRMFHGTRAQFDEFSNDQAGGLIHFTDSPDTAAEYASGAGGNRRRGEPIFVHDETGQMFERTGDWEWTDQTGKKFDRTEMERMQAGGDLSVLREGAQTIPVFLSVQNPLDLKTDAGVKVLSGLDDQNNRYAASVIRKASEGRFDWGDTKNEAETRHWNDILVPQLKALGYDGVRFRDHMHDTVAVFSPSQIKSAIVNSGRFDPVIPDITSRPGPSGADPTASAEPTTVEDRPAATGDTLSATETPADRVAVAAAQKAIADRGDFVIRMDDGREIKASEALREADEAIRQAKIDAQAFDAAINCFMR